MLYETDTYDWRLLAMTITACAVANLPVILRYQQFEHNHIQWIKNLPITLMRRYLRLMSVLTFFWIPETVMLMKFFPVYLQPFWMFLTPLYLLSLGSLLLGLVHIKYMRMEGFTKMSFWIFIILTILILFKVPLVSLCVTNFAAGLILFCHNYYSFESHYER